MAVSKKKKRPRSNEGQEEKLTPQSLEISSGVRGGGKKKKKKKKKKRIGA